MMELNDASKQSNGFVQKWVNSIPSVAKNIARRTVSVPVSSSQPKLQTCSDRNGCEEPISSAYKNPLLSSSANNTSNLHGMPHSSRADIRSSWITSNHGSFSSESSIDHLLEERKVNPEEFLLNLGFGGHEDSLADRLPFRFLSSNTKASGITLENFMRYHPDLGTAFRMDSSLALAELYSRLPAYYYRKRPGYNHTILHKQFTVHTSELVNNNTSPPYNLHKAEDGTTFASILSEDNMKELAKQGFYSERPPLLSTRQGSCSSMSTHDCTIESSDIPSPIVLSSELPDSKPNLLQNFKKNSSQSLGSDSVFSSTEEAKADNYILSRLESIQEKSLQEMSDHDVEEGMGISFINRRYSTGDLKKIEFSTSFDSLPDNIMHKRALFARMNSVSLDEEDLSKMLQESLVKYNGGQKVSVLAPVIVKTDFVDEDKAVNEKVIPKQMQGLLQVATIDSFDSVDSDSGTVVPSPNDGLSPSTSRAGSISVIPALESFELEEIQITVGTNEQADHFVKSKETRKRLLKSVSQRSDSDSSGIADVDSKSHNERGDSPDRTKDFSPESNSSPVQEDGIKNKLNDEECVSNLGNPDLNVNVKDKNHNEKYPNGSMSSSPMAYSKVSTSAVQCLITSQAQDVQTQTEHITCYDVCLQTDDVLLPQYNHLLGFVQNISSERAEPAQRRIFSAETATLTFDAHSRSESSLSNSACNSPVKFFLDSQRGCCSYDGSISSNNSSSNKLSLDSLSEKDQRAVLNIFKKYGHDQSVEITRNLERITAAENENKASAALPLVVSMATSQVEHHGCSKTSASATSDIGGSLSNSSSKELDLNQMHSPLASSPVVKNNIDLNPPFQQFSCYQREYNTRMRHAVSDLQLNVNQNRSNQSFEQIRSKQSRTAPADYVSHLQSNMSLHSEPANSYYARLADQVSLLENKRRYELSNAILQDEDS